MPQLDPSGFLPQIFWLIVFFSLQYFFVVKLIVPKFKSTFVDRKNFLFKTLAEAEGLAVEADRLVKEYESKLAEARQSNLESTKLTLEKIKQNAELQLQEVEKKLQADFASNEKRLKNYIESVSADIDNLSLEVASIVLEKLGGKKVSTKDLTKYLN